jgi:hypothetical protein
MRSTLSNAADSFLSFTKDSPNKFNWIASCYKEPSRLMYLGQYISSEECRKCDEDKEAKANEGNHEEKVREVSSPKKTWAKRKHIRQQEKSGT